LDQDIYCSGGEYYGIEEKGVSNAVSSDLRLESCVPNPVSVKALLAFSLSHPATTSLALYDVSGRRVKTLTQGPREAGYHIIHWDGDDEAGHPVPPGIYFYRLNAGEFTQTRSMVVVR
jgi:hypothetical protein